MEPRPPAATTSLPNSGTLTMTSQPECLSCRVIGATVLSGSGAYTLYQSAISQPPASLYGRRIMAGVGAVFIAAGIARGYGVQHTDVMRGVEKVQEKLGGSS